MGLFFTYILFDSFNDAIVTNTSELLLNFLRVVFIDLLLPLSFFFAVMLTFLVNWSWIPISKNERKRGIGIEELKTKLID
tara:strand:+ start:597 stop:836 length:240 start_codon:yes stop_codon:yes gene_type:complete